jgi:putative flippase GtrA
MQTMTSKQILQFLIVGGSAFLVDFAIFYIGLNFFDHNLYIVRSYAFFFAVLVTFYGNRRLTFKDRFHLSSKVQIPRAFTSALLSLIPNFTIFTLIVALLPSPIFHYIAFVFGVVAGTVSNYILSDKYIFNSES